VPTFGPAQSLDPLDEVSPITAIRRRAGVTGIPRVVMMPALVRGLPIDPRDAFVLSHVDGQSSVETLVDVTGFDRAELISILGRLVRLGAIAV
jgi:hypothetical protein